MRCLLTAKLDTQTSNQLIRSGRVADVMQQALAEIKHEAAYFAPDAGRRAIFLIVDLTDASELVTKLEPFWLAMGAEVDITPVMTREDLERGLQAMAPNVGKYTS
jgi:hypothetical protein